MAEKPKGAVLTEYVVLQRVELPKEATDLLGIEWRANTTAWAPVLNATAEQGPDGQVRVFTAPGRAAAIRQHTGFGADVVEGTWKAVAVSSWKGDETTKRKMDSEHVASPDTL